MLEAVLFDKDGVLIDSSAVNYEATRRAFEKFGYNLTKEEYIDFWTNSLRGMKEFLKEKRLGIDIERIKGIREEFMQELAPGITLIPFAAELLKSLDGIKKAVVSSDYYDRIYNHLEWFGLIPYFDAVLCGPKSVKGKPTPDPYLIACEEQLCVKPANVVVIEDSPMGAESARLAGCRVIFFPNGFTADMKYDRADAVIHGLNEITPAMLERLVE